MTDGSNDALDRIAALETQLEAARDRLVTLEASAPIGCGVPAHVTAPAQIEKLEAQLVRLQAHSTVPALVDRLGKARRRRLTGEVVQLHQQVEAARERVLREAERGALDLTLLDTLKELRIARDEKSIELRMLRDAR